MHVFPSSSARLRGLAGGLACTALLSGCAAPPPPAPPRVAAAPVAEVLTVRRLDPALPVPAALAPILPAGAQHWPPGLSEVILREQNGTTLAVMETLPPGLAPGQSVAIIDGQTRPLAAPGS